MHRIKATYAKQARAEAKKGKTTPGCSKMPEKIIAKQKRKEREKGNKKES